MGPLITRKRPGKRDLEDTLNPTQNASPHVKHATGARENNFFKP
jgi:hypothetical protein